ncbi:DUF885 domain-containing protein [Kutzneria kofuensis]|uniref:DUF885 domain-containing protein n=1 Tax=Kutzneria kofuensis TaxID=103725 RepID=A0A7W9KFP8_9PSEU|nr:DUF885 domain-containing protein [Kutzneria kofuensis]MBB5891733.1 hypothetical protein [Kutzneria kofuensis]
MELQVVREYLTLGLRMDRLLPGAVDAYTGPAALRAQVAGEPVPDPGELRLGAAELRRAVADADLSPQRREFLTAQLVAMETTCARLAGRPIGFVAEVETCFQTTIGLGDPDVYAQAHRQLRRLLPGLGSLRRRVARYRSGEEIPKERIGDCVQVLSADLRARAAERFGLPAGESVQYEIVDNRAWSGFNSYLGGYRSRVSLNVAQGHRVSTLAHLIAHEAYPGHHTEHCRKEAGAIRVDGQWEQSMFVLNTPQCVVAEGLAELGVYAAVGPHWGAWATALFAEAGVHVDGELLEAVDLATTTLQAVRQDAMLMLHDRGADEDDVVGFLSRWLLVPEFRAYRLLPFLTDPLWRAYTTTYVEGSRLVRRWLAARGPVDLATRYSRLLDEPLVPAGLRAELTTTPSSFR